MLYYAFKEASGSLTGVSSEQITGNIEKINENYRYKLTIKCRADRRFRDLVRQTLGLYEQEKLPAKATVAVDMHSDGDI